VEDVHDRMTKRLRPESATVKQPEAEQDDQQLTKHPS
ncbi:MAG: hypothetical protein JWQ76_1457, partial [Ramlibacter sp.]|nr:hypothetical protein [Ramlibacter sp.]